MKDLEKNIQDKGSEIDKLTNTLHPKDNHIRNLETMVQSINQSIVWQSVIKYQKIIDKLLPHGTRRRNCYDLGLIGSRIIFNDGWRSLWWKLKRKQKLEDSYQIWLKLNTPTDKNIEKYREDSKNFRYRPKISVITPVYNVDEKWLKACIESVINQVYDNWELCLVDDASTKSHIKKVLESYKNKEKRIKIKYLEKNLGISGASNEALSLATGDFVGFLDNDDELTSDALYEIVRLINQDSELNFIYSDEDKIDKNGRLFNPFFKPNWSPDLLLSCGYTNHFSVYRREIVDMIGRFRTNFEPSQDYDMLLRFIDVIDERTIGHISKILYHWRQISGSTAKDPYAKNGLVIEMAKSALKDALDRRNIRATVLDGKWPGSYRIKREILGNSLISIIIPTKDKLEFLKNCIESIKNKTTYKNYEILIIDNNSVELETLEYLDKLKLEPNLTVLRYSEKFNFSKINNFGAYHANGDYLIFLNNDTEVISSDWIEAMLEHAQRSDVGAVGCKLLYPDKSIQHAGVILGLSPDPVTGVAGHIFNKFNYDNQGYFGLINTVRDYSAVTAAVMMIRKNVFEHVGGFNEDLAVCYNDVDMCLRLREKGYLIIYTPYAELYHYESLSRCLDIDIHEARYMLNKWSIIIKNDPYYNRNLSLRSYNCELNIG